MSKGWCETFLAISGSAIADHSRAPALVETSGARSEWPQCSSNGPSFGEVPECDPEGGERGIDVANVEGRGGGLMLATGPEDDDNGMSRTTPIPASV